VDVRAEAPSLAANLSSRAITLVYAVGFRLQCDMFVFESGAERDFWADGVLMLVDMARCSGFYSRTLVGLRRKFYALRGACRDGDDDLISAIDFSNYWLKLKCEVSM
jgi:hypothetical protein